MRLQKKLAVIFNVKQEFNFSKVALISIQLGGVVNR